MRTRSVFACVVVLVCFAAGVDLAHGQIAGTEGITELFTLGEERVAAYDPSRAALRVFARNTSPNHAEEVKEVLSIPVEGNVMAATDLFDGAIAYATGMIARESSKPIQVFVWDPARKASTRIFEYSGERNQVTGLVWSNSRLWIDFFNSKYFTSVGYLSPQKDRTLPWSFAEVANLRMGDSFDHLGETLVVGRSYGDEQGQDGDLVLYRDGTRQLLPSYRGVRGVRLFGDPLNPSIVIGDGWHSHYGVVAQARVSLLRKRSGEPRYALELLDKDTTNYAFDTFFVFQVNAAQRMAAVGNKSIVVYAENSTKEWGKVEIYKQQREGLPLRAALLKSVGVGVTLIVLDGGLHLVHYAR